LERTPSWRRFLTSIRVWESREPEILGDSIPNSEKIFSIYEGPMDIIVKEAREVAFGHKVNLTTGRSNLILDCEIVDRNPKDSNLYEGGLDRVRSDYGIRPRDKVSDKGYASLGNQEKAKEYGSDGMPQLLYEAMACGSYPILGNLDSYRELIQDGVNGRLVEVGDVEVLGEAMCWVAAHPEHRKTAAIMNRQWIVEVADKEGQDRIVLSIYEELLKKYAKYGYPDNV
jgi:hypothetical protein